MPRHAWLGAWQGDGAAFALHGSGILCYTFPRMNPRPFLSASHLSRRFGSVQALKDVSIDFFSGEIHSIIGENGAGKSTLMKILSGIDSPDSGTVELQGEGSIAMIHQELSGVPDLSVSANLFLGRERTSRGRLNLAAMREESLRLLESLGGGISPDALLGELSIAQQQRVEIAKALSCKARVLILDEPTAVLPADDCERLFALLMDLRAQGVSLLFISHHLNEVVRLSDRITVLRDGCVTAHLGPFDSPEKRPSEEELASRMVGREIGDYFPARSPAPPAETPALSVRHWTTPDVSDLSLDLFPGEILGLAGLIGSGRTEFAESLIGLRPGHGELSLFGTPYVPQSPLQALRSGLVYLPEDRKGSGLSIEQSIRENISLADLRSYGTFHLDLPREKKTAASAIESLGIRSSSMEAPVSSLSGGNQQKVLVAKWLETRPRVLLVDEPTRGVDIGARQEIYALLHRLAASGAAILLISSELNEVLGLCHRIAVFRSGRLAGILPGATATDRDIMSLAAL